MPEACKKKKTGQQLNNQTPMLGLTPELVYFLLLLLLGLC
jgi:hypothetical protein